MKSDFFCASEFIIIGNSIWFVPLGYRYLCCYDIEQKKMLKQFLIPNNERQVSLYESVVFVENKLFFIPYAADYFLIFDFARMEFEMISIEAYKTRGIGFYANCIYKEFIYFFPRSRERFAHNNCIIGRINLKTYEIVYQDLQELCQNKPDTELLQILFRKELFLDGNTVYLLYKEGGVLQIKLSEEENIIEEVKLLEEQYFFTSVCSIDLKKIYFTDNRGKIQYYDKDTYQLKNLDCHIDNFVPIKNKYWYSECFSYSVQYHTYIYLFPSEANMVLQVDIDNMTVEEAFFSKRICADKENFEYSFGQFSKPYIKMDNLFVWNIWSGYFYCIDLFSKEIKEIKIDAFMKEEELFYSCSDWYAENEVIKETSLLYSNLESVLWYLKTSKESVQHKKSIDSITGGMVGENIWSKMKEE